ncbi:MAG: hypothetical protein NT144_13190 [Bacteroidia bacterium]|nr:hypothetical protein [Bacteroidia bacterium]
MLKRGKDIKIKNGKKITLDASKSSDPDGNNIVFSWWQYKEAGTFNGTVKINDQGKAKINFVAPEVREPQSIHIILKVSDNGNPSLCAYQRVIITVVP